MEKITDLLEQLAAKLGVAVDVLWAALMRQAFYTGIGDLIFFAVIGVSVYYLVKWGKWIVNKRVDEIAWIPLGVAGMVVAVMAGCAISNLPMTFAEFFNPQYWAIHEIFGHIK